MSITRQASMEDVTQQSRSWYSETTFLELLMARPRLVVGLTRISLHLSRWWIPSNTCWTWKIRKLGPPKKKRISRPPSSIIGLSKDRNSLNRRIWCPMRPWGSLKLLKNCRMSSGRPWCLRLWWQGINSTQISLRVSLSKPLYFWVPLRQDNTIYERDASSYDIEL